jgi:hypothetical protein
VSGVYLQPNKKETRHSETFGFLLQLLFRIRFVLACALPYDPPNVSLLVDM